jgi:phosphatidylserine/phosphatidylglycerophosphate/cardiolipin synthase-like enzyme
VRARGTLDIALGLALVLSSGTAVGASHAIHPVPGDFLCPVAVRFSPHGGAEGAIVDTLRRARVRVHVAIYGLTNRAIETALADLARAGIKVALKADRSQTSGKSQAALLARLNDAGVAVEVLQSRALLHDKFAIVDDRWVITGSFNWTARAERLNRENVLIFDCPALASNFETEWETIPTR